MLRLIALTMCLFVISLANTDHYEETGFGEEEELDDLEDFDENHNATGLGEYVGAPCDETCNQKLIHVVCDHVTRHCECERKYPVVLGQHIGCGKPVRLGEQCFYFKTCSFSDQNAECVQIKHNAICQCKRGYHTVTLQRPNKKVFCSQDLLVVTTDVPTLLGVASGLAIFTALICFVLKLFVGARPRHYANANLAPPILFASDTGIPLTVHNIRSASRASSERSGVANYSQRGSRGVLVPASRAGAARAAAILLISCHLTPEQTQQTQQGSRVLSLASVHSSTSSSRSYSAKRYEREKEQRLLAARQREAVTPSPRSTEQLLSGNQQESDGSWVLKVSDKTNSIDTSDQRTEKEAGSSTSLPGVSSSLPLYEGGVMGPCTSEEWPQIRS